MVLEVMRHVGASSLVVSSRGIREGLALATTAGGGVPTPAWVRTISVATLAARFATWEPRAAERRARIALHLHDELDPEGSPRVREMLEHAATMLDVGRAIDYYERFEHAAMIVTAADLAGFSHPDLGALTAILLQADDDTTLGPYGRLIPREDRPTVLKAATALALADSLNRRVEPDAELDVSSRWTTRSFEVSAPVQPGWQPGGVARRFARVFGKRLVIVPASEGVTPGR